VQWSDRGIVLSVKCLGESSGVVHLLTPTHGMCAGVDKGAFSRGKRGIYQPGNIVEAQWKARLAEHLGMLSSELTQATAAHLLHSRHKLAALTSATKLTEKMMAERDAQPDVYAAMEALIQALCEGDDWLAQYVRLEYTLLACAGFRLDLERCASTGQEHDLIYVSPKSGRAVSRGAGEPYRERLLNLPAFMMADAQNVVADMLQILDGLRLCGHFLHARVFAPRGIPVPAARAHFIEALQA